MPLCLGLFGHTAFQFLTGTTLSSVLGTLCFLFPLIWSAPHLSGPFPGTPSVLVLGPLVMVSYRAGFLYHCLYVHMVICPSVFRGLGNRDRVKILGVDPSFTQVFGYCIWVVGA